MDAEPYVVLNYPDPGLKRVGLPVTDFGEATQNIIDRMMATLDSSAAAYAACQLDMPNPPAITVIAANVVEADEPLCLVNPEILEREGAVEGIEGCMSVYPEEIEVKVTRAERIRVKAQDRHGALLEFEATEFLARCIQHEYDHLQGITIMDRISRLKADRVRKKIEAYLKNKASQ